MISSAVKISVLAALLYVIAQACDIQVTITSSTNKDYFVQIKAPNGTTSELLRFHKREQKEKVHLTGELCGFNATTVSSYKVNPEGAKGQRVNQHKAMIDGIGMVRYSLLDDGQIMMDSRAGVMCSFAQCGSRGK